MKNTFRIWILAILYQTLIFLYVPGQLNEPDVLFILLPVELIGGLPGLFLFGVMMQQLHRSRYSTGSKWFLAITGAMSSALLTTLLTAVCFGVQPDQLFTNRFSLVYPAPIAALLGILTFIPSVNKYLNENSI